MADKTAGVNPLPWRIASDMEEVRYRLEQALADINLLNRPVPPMAKYRMSQMKDLLETMMRKD